MANVALHFAHLVPEDQLEARLFSVIFAVVDQTFFQLAKKLSQFAHNVQKYKLVNAVITNFNTNMRQMTKTSHKKNRLEVISKLNMCSCPINILDFWYNRRNIKDGSDNSEFTKLYDLMAIFSV